MILDYQLKIEKNPTTGRFDWVYRAFRWMGDRWGWQEWTGHGEDGRDAIAQVERIEATID